MKPKEKPSLDRLEQKVQKALELAGLHPTTEEIKKITSSVSVWIRESFDYGKYCTGENGGMCTPETDEEYVEKLREYGSL